MAKSTSIHINGKHYDALTGRLLSENGARKAPVRSIDGVVAQRKHASTTTKLAPKPARPTDTPVKHIAKPRPVREAARTQAPHAKVHHNKPSRTLMRHTVAKPGASTKASLKVQSHLHAVAAPHMVVISDVAAIKPKVGMRSIHAKRLHRANKVQAHPRVAHFAHELTVDLPRAAEHVVASIDKAIVIPQTFAPDISFQPVAKAAPRSNDVFEQALQRATSTAPQEPLAISKSKRRRFSSLRRRMVSYGAGAMVVLALVGVLGFTNAETIKYRMASNSAGFSASIPAYHPSGFNLASVQSRSGYVGARYVGKVNGTTRSFAITQKPSNWNSEALRSTIASSGENVEVNMYEQAGRTVFVYGSNQAAWVSGGVLYQILGNGSLSTRDFVQIATSI